MVVEGKQKTASPGKKKAFTFATGTALSVWFNG
jgi:hypothetical protein